MSEEIQNYHRDQLIKKSGKESSELLSPIKNIPYVIHDKTSHVCTVSPIGWNTTETEHMYNVLFLLPKVKRRRQQSQQLDETSLISSDNYVTHHTFPEVNHELNDENIVTPTLVPNSTDIVQWCDTDLNSCLKVKQKKQQGIQLYQTILESMDVDLEMKDVPQDPEEIRTMYISVENAIKIPQVTRGQAHFNTLLSLAELSYTMNGDGFFHNGHAANTQGEWLRYSARSKAKRGRKRIEIQNITNILHDNCMTHVVTMLRWTTA